MVPKGSSKRVDPKNAPGAPGEPPRKSLKSSFLEVNFAHVLDNINIFDVGVFWRADYQKSKNQSFFINISQIKEVNIL